MRQIVAMIIVVLGFATGASAQTQVILNPRAIQFESPDHNSVLSGPNAYAVDFYAQGATSPLQSPSVAASAVALVPGTNPQKYEITFAQLTSYPPGQVFTVKVRPVNLAGSAEAVGPPDPFGKASRPAPISKPSLVP